MVLNEGWVNVLNKKWDKNTILEETIKIPPVKASGCNVEGDQYGGYVIAYEA
ncbi:hypothetical protein Cni_G28084 [Canna indica]|uniref:Uncharacterized protein n=1 Tax=Canna indica TaxID=4628 RepID=A0AAQ3L6V7_9LILI|nr:hypothetical protein Cni_G28084 [Canna indica]